MSLLEQVGMMQISNLYIYWTMKCLLLLSSMLFIDGFLLFSHMLMGLFFHSEETNHMPFESAQQ
jgi:hypothetical protein